MRTRLGSIALQAVAVLTIGSMMGEAQSVMTRHVREVVGNGQARATGRLPGNEVLQLNLVLPLRDAAGLKSFLADVYNPASPNYRHFLTPQQFTARFGPTQEQYDDVLRFAKTYGFQVVGGSRDQMDVEVKGSVANIEAAFHVNMRTYHDPAANRDFYSPDTEPTMDLPFNLWHISGLNNYSIPHPLLVNKNDYAAAQGMQPDEVNPNATTGSGPSASFLGSDMRAAYYGSGTLTGAGQTVGLLEYAGTDLADLQTYYTNARQTYPGGVITLFSTDGTSTSCVSGRHGGCDDTEQTLDMTQALGMAPGLSQLVMFVGSTDTAMIGAMTTYSPLPSAIGCSWGWTPADPTTLDPYFEKMASQGQTFFAASGDYSTWKASGNSEAWPADDANVVSVGGTDLTTSGAEGSWKTETAWADSGGGISPDKIAIPSWQQLSGVINSSNNGSTTLRNGPDVAANANFTFYVCADQKACTANLYGGTSFAAPMWAGYVALVNQQLAANGATKGIGFLNPTIYAQNVGSGYAADFHDITSGTSGSYSAVTGYDLVTGWGSPNAGLMAALTGTGSGTTGSFTLSNTGGPTIQAGNQGSVTITDAITGGPLSSTVALSQSGIPSGWTYTFNPTSLSSTTSSSSLLTITVPSGSTGQTYPITVSGVTTGTGGETETTQFNLTVTAAPAGDFSITAASPLSVTVNSSNSEPVTITPSNGFNSSVSLSIAFSEKNVTATLSPTTISGGSGASTLKVTASRKATTGSYTATITATGGGKTHTATVTVTVMKAASKP